MDTLIRLLDINLFNSLAGDVKKICESGLYALPLEPGSVQAAESSSKVRSLSDYRRMTGLGVIGHE